MKKFLLFIVVCCISALKAYAQTSAATATVVTPVMYTGAPTTTNYTLQLGTAQTFNTCVGTNSVHWFKFNIPVPASSANGTRSVKITATSGAFSPVIDFYDATVTFKQCVTGTIMRTAPTTNAVIPGQDYYFRISSTALATGATFALAIEYYPVAEVRNGFYPSVDADGYHKCEQIRRNNLAFGTATNSRFRLVPTSSPNFGGCSAVVLGNNTIANTSQFSCTCFGIEYLCYVEVEMDGHWCGESTPRAIVFQDYPATTITSTNYSTIQLAGGQIQADFACGGNYQWRFTGQNGISYTYNSNTSSFALLDNLECLRYNRLYQVEVRLNATCDPTIWSPWSGISGPNSAPMVFFTPPIPTITIPSNYCNTVLNPNTYVDVAYVPNNTFYHFQTTRVTPTAPYTPIAPPILVLTNQSSGYNLQGNVAGATYRMCFKPSINTCNSPQEGSWGPYCYYSIAPGTAPSGFQLETPQDDLAVLQVVDESISENPQESDVTIYKHGSETIVVIDLKENVITGTARLAMYNVNGQLVYSDNFPYSTGVSVLQLSMPSDLVDGTYFLNVTCDTYSATEKVVLAGVN
jgi:hypothetical protein